MFIVTLTIEIDAATADEAVDAFRAVQFDVPLVYLVSGAATDEPEGAEDGRTFTIERPAIAYPEGR